MLDHINETRKTPSTKKKNEMWETIHKKKKKKNDDEVNIEYWSNGKKCMQNFPF